MSVIMCVDSTRGDDRDKAAQVNSPSCLFFPLTRACSGMAAAEPDCPRGRGVSGGPCAAPSRRPSGRISGRAEAVTPYLAAGRGGRPRPPLVACEGEVPVAGPRTAAAQPRESILQTRLFSPK